MTEIKDDKLQKDKMTLIIFMEMMQVQYDKIVEQNKSLQQELREKTAECEQLILVNKSLEKPYLQLYEKAERYKQVLDEIERFIKSVKRDTPDYESDYVLGKILKIINDREQAENDG